MSQVKMMIETINDPHELGMCFRFGRYKADGSGDIDGVADPLTFSPITKGQSLPNAGKCFNLDRQQCEALIEGLWAAGIRPESKYLQAEMIKLESTMVDELIKIKEILAGQIAVQVTLPKPEPEHVPLNMQVIDLVDKLTSYDYDSDENREAAINAVEALLKVQLTGSLLPNIEIRDYNPKEAPDAGNIPE